MQKPQKQGDSCGRGHEVRRAERMFYFRGHYFHGLLCDTCKSLWEDPDDSMFQWIAENVK